jgi:hypothetical protein
VKNGDKFEVLDLVIAEMKTMIEENKRAIEQSRAILGETA